MEALESLEKKQVEYEKAKQEDRLHAAIAIRAEIEALKTEIQSVTTETMDSWKKPSEDQETLQQMQETLLEKVGTRRALRFIEEFADFSLAKIAEEDLSKALEIQNKARERMKQIAAEQPDSPPKDQKKMMEEKEKRMKEEEDRWKREAAERKKKKKEKIEQLQEVVGVNEEIKERERSNSLSSAELKQFKQRKESMKQMTPFED